MASRFSLILVFFAFLSLVSCHPSETSSKRRNSDSDDPLVQTDLFAVQRTVSNISDTVRLFQGIPYAEPPIGSARFRPPITKKPTSDIINATYYGPSCIQLNTGAPSVYSPYLYDFNLASGQQQLEDCLTLNVWAPRGKGRPEKGSKELLPVMIWIHGGGFTADGSAVPYQEGAELVRDHQDVIVVSMKCV